MVYIQFVDCSYCTSITNIIKCTRPERLLSVSGLTGEDVCVCVYKSMLDNPRNNTLYEYYMQIRRRSAMNSCASDTFSKTRVSCELTRQARVFFVLYCWMHT